ncbi:MAG: HAMP domain-containing histidine kinase, partial [Clostridia bacterium]|nr:HAMP domain-containing histidine kinase [Clostridia bacterium]
ITCVDRPINDRCFCLLLLAVLLTSVTRFKYGHWWHNTVLWRAIKLCVAITKACVKGTINCFTALRYEWRVALAVITFSLVSISGGGPALCALAVTLVLCCLSANRLRRLFEGAEEIAGGNVDYKIEEDGLHGQLRNHAVNLNSIAGGLGIAVEQRIKSERLKTELITNVSHDIKTPLTSIINYVDLLKKEPLTGKAHEYANTLERHANRLKKLTEDLVEASKAATGNIKAELIPMNVCELINQAVGEYSERLEKSRIEPVVAIPEAPRYILADGRLIWRVIENLLSNAAKYAQPGTRLYISLIERHGRVVIEMKNISRERLNIDAEELTERFVRGDSSRHTEGSGLGLNIARSLTELQHGSMDIEIDGDLFKVSLAFEALDDQMDFLDELPIDI